MRAQRAKHLIEPCSPKSRLSKLVMEGIVGYSSSAPHLQDFLCDAWLLVTGSIKTEKNGAEERIEGNRLWGQEKCWPACPFWGFLRPQRP